MYEKKGGWGGYRPGSGRKPGIASGQNPNNLTSSRSLTLRANEWEALEKLAGSEKVMSYVASILRAYLLAQNNLKT